MKNNQQIGQREETKEESKTLDHYETADSRPAEHTVFID